MDLYDQLKSYISRTNDLRGLQQIAVAMERMFFHHCSATNAFRRQFKFGHCLDGEEVDGEGSESDGDGENSEFEESDDELYDYGSGNYIFLWTDVNVRNGWLHAISSNSSIHPQSLYFRFFQLAHAIYQWCERNKIDSKFCKRHISADGPTMSIPNDALYKSCCLGSS